jgi:diaminopimelate decarboxylase
MTAVLKVLRNLGFGIDVASAGELHQVLNTGIDPEHILATGPGKSKKYLEHLVDSGVEMIVLESINQAYWLNEIAQKKNKKIDCLLRVQLDWDDGKSVLGGDDITPFGISSKEWLELNSHKTSSLNIRGFHVFQWGNILDLSRLEKIWRKTIEEIQELSIKMSIPLDVLDLGGGLGIPYNFEDSPIDFTKVHDLLVTLKTEYKLNKIWMELGRFTVGECGYYFTTVIDRKKSRNRDILVCDGGINHIARVALVNQPFPAKAFDDSNKDKKHFHVHGSLCTALDFLGDFDFPEDIAIDDWIVFHKAGAYGFTESMPFFLCHTLPGEVIYYDGDLMIPRPPKTSYDWMI